VAVATEETFARRLPEFLLAYGVTAIPMAIALIQRGASWRTYIRWPIASLFAALVSAFAWWFIRSRLLTANPNLNQTLMWFAGVVFFMVLGYCVGIAMSGSTHPITHKRGAVVDENRAQERPRRGELTLAGIGIQAPNETKHFKLIDTTGTGKSTAIRELLAGLLNRCDRAIIADPDGGYVNRFYQATAGDLILNLFDDRSRRWDPFAEIERAYDVEQLSRALIPDDAGEDRTWRTYARTFVTAVTRQLWELGAKDPQYRDARELYRLISTAETEELRILVKNTPAQPFLEPGNERMFGSIRSVASANVAALEHVAEQSADGLSVREWVRGGRGRALYLPYSAMHISALRSVISAWMRLAIFEAMNGGERDQRL
jgi:type IV secretory pathway TraG/TraD family ATPase VirD4